MGCRFTSVIFSEVPTALHADSVAGACTHTTPIELHIHMPPARPPRGSSLCPCMRKRNHGPCSRGPACSDTLFEDGMTRGGKHLHTEMLREVKPSAADGRGGGASAAVWPSIRQRSVARRQARDTCACRKAVRTPKRRAKGLLDPRERSVDGEAGSAWRTTDVPAAQEGKQETAERISVWAQRSPCLWVGRRSPFVGSLAFCAAPERIKREQTRSGVFGPGMRCGSPLRLSLRFWWLHARVASLVRDVATNGGRSIYVCDSASSAEGIHHWFCSVVPPVCGGAPHARRVPFNADTPRRLLGARNRREGKAPAFGCGSRSPRNAV